MVEHKSEKTFYVKVTGPMDHWMGISTGSQDILQVTEQWTSGNFEPCIHICTHTHQYLHTNVYFTSKDTHTHTHTHTHTEHGAHQTHTHTQTVPLSYRIVVLQSDKSMRRKLFTAQWAFSLQQNAPFMPTAQQSVAKWHMDELYLKHIHMFGFQFNCVLDCKFSSVP